ncbi:hypothetical protein [Streptomyces sp. NPDC059874]|uniref:hypothetical protein n=1 Tax=Streptomyces sp. NPDC059874 TaxID=3346983 RepID=UPI0036684A76
MPQSGRHPSAPLVLRLVDAGGFQRPVRTVACEPADKRPAVDCWSTALRVGDQVMAGGNLVDNACLSAAAQRRPVAVVPERLP